MQRLPPLRGVQQFVVSCFSQGLRACFLNREDKIFPWKLQNQAEAAPSTVGVNLMTVFSGMDLWMIRWVSGPSHLNSLTLVRSDMNQQNSISCRLNPHKLGPRITSHLFAYPSIQWSTKLRENFLAFCPHTKQQFSLFKRKHQWMLDSSQRGWILQQVKKHQHSSFPYSKGFELPLGPLTHQDNPDNMSRQVFK